MVSKQPKLLDRARHSLRQRNYSYRTENSYVNWMRRYILFHNKQHPRKLGEPEIEEFFTYLVVKKKVLGIELNEINALRPRKNRHLPTVLTFDEVLKIFFHKPIISYLLNAEGKL